MGDASKNLGQVGEDTAALIAAADADRNKRARAQRLERKRIRTLGNDPGLRVSINPPHKIQCNGNNLAITVIPEQQNQQRGGAGGSGQLEFALYDASAGGSPTLGIRMGVITPWNPTFGYVPWPAEFTSATSYKAEFSVSGNGLAWIKVNASGGSPTGFHVGITSGDTPLANTPTVGYLIIGTYTTDESGLIITSGQSGVGNQFYNWCSGHHIWGPA